MKATWVLAALLSLTLAVAAAAETRPDIGYGQTPSQAVRRVFELQKIRRINIVEPYALVSATGTGPLFGREPSTEFLLEHFDFGWQVVEMARALCPLQRGMTASTVRNLMAGMPKQQITAADFCNDIDSGPTRSISQVRKLMYGPVVPFVRVVDGYAFSENFGDGGGCGLFRFESGSNTWKKLGGCKGMMNPNVLTDNHISHETACKLRAPVAGLRCAGE